MAPSTTSEEAVTRARIVRVFGTQGAIGLLAMLVLTWFQFDRSVQIFGQLGAGAWGLTLIFFVFACVLQLLKFEWTELVFATLSLSCFVSMIPLLGGVVTAWTAIVATMFTRLLGMRHVGPVKIDVTDARLEYVKTFGLFGTYGLPVVLATLLYQQLGGIIPIQAATRLTVLQLLLGGISAIVVNNLVVARMMKAYGYDAHSMFRLLITDFAIHLLTLPYAICLTLSYAAIGWGAVVALSFTGIMATMVARNLAVTRAASQQQLQRLASLSNIGKTISLQFTTEELLQTIYTECRKVVDATNFSIALLDELTDELSFEFDVQNGVRAPRQRIEVGDGLNSWVVKNHQPLLIGGERDERRLGIVAFQDGLVTESWLGVPMIARDRVIGVISIQSNRRNAFSHDDLLLLTAVANQAAVALESANLYKDLEGLTYALEQRVLERTRELNETNLRLMAADRSKNQFLANMSHELRTPLNSIIGFSSVLLDATRELLPARLFKFLENIRTAGNHLLELINDILDLSKIEAGKMELRPDRFDPRDTVAAVERVMKGMAADSHVQILSEVKPDVPAVCLDEGRLKQILFNLLSNAVKFSPKGGPVQLIVSYVDKVVSPLSVDAIRIEVRDQGIGIPEVELTRIFDEFYQTDHSRTSKKGGTGLGLSLTRNFVELHFGTIDVLSTVGKGSSFTMLLPVDYYEAAELSGLRSVQVPRLLREQPPTVH